MKRFELKIITYAIMSFICLLLGSSQAFAVEKITGAFGIELGKKFDPSTVTGKRSLADGTSVHRFKPKKRYHTFSNHYMKTTPKSHLVYSISADGDMENKSVCENEQAILMSILESKYGPRKKQFFRITLDNHRTIYQMQNNRFVDTWCFGLTDEDVSINIQYIDYDLSAQAEKERIEIETEKVDSSGL